MSNVHARHSAARTDRQTESDTLFVQVQAPLSSHRKVCAFRRLCLLSFLVAPGPHAGQGLGIPLLHNGCHRPEEGSPLSDGILSSPPRTRDTLREVTENLSLQTTTSHQNYGQIQARRPPTSTQTEHRHCQRRRTVVFRDSSLQNITKCDDGKRKNSYANAVFLGGTTIFPTQKKVRSHVCVRVLSHLCSSRVYVPGGPPVRNHHHCLRRTSRDVTCHETH